MYYETKSLSRMWKNGCLTLRPIQTLTKYRLHRIVWRCSHCTDTDTDPDYYCTQLNNSCLCLCLCLSQFQYRCQCRAVWTHHKGHGSWPWMACSTCVTLLRYVGNFRPHELGPLWQNPGSAPVSTHTLRCNCFVYWCHVSSKENKIPVVCLRLLFSLFGGHRSVMSWQK